MRLRSFPARSRAVWVYAWAAVIAFGLPPQPALAVLERAGEHIHDASAFRLFTTNLGVLGNPTYPSFSDHPSLEWPAGSGNEFLLEAGLWIGARDRTGAVIGVSTAGPVSELRPSLDLVDHVYASFDGAPGTRRLGTTVQLEEADDDLDGAFDEEFLNGKDDDGDGRIDEDYPAVGSQMFTSEYRDDTEEARQQLLAHRPLGLKVEQSSWVWAEGVTGLDHAVVVHYRVKNVSPATLFDVFLGFYVDPDVGPKARDGHWRDDLYSVEQESGTIANHSVEPRPGCTLVPFDRTVVVTEDAPDGTGGAAGGDAPGVIGALILDQTTHPFAFRGPDVEAQFPRAIVHLAGRITFDRTREEISDPEKYALLARTGYDGDNTISDHRFIMTAGPYPELLPGASIDLTCALVVAADRADLAANVRALEDQFHGRWVNLDGLSSTGRDGRETCLTKFDAPYCFFSPMEVDHDCDEPQTKVRHHAGCWNPFLQTFCPGAPGPPENRCTPRTRVLTEQCVFVDMDCDSCTPNTAGAESLVRWADTVTEVSSRPLAKEVAAGDRTAVIEWDNAAELPTAQRELPPVAGYRVWRAEGWTRPPGASGPLAEQWRLVAELPLPTSGLPPPKADFIVDGVPVIEQVPGPKDSLYDHYEVGRYRYEDSGLLNGFAVFYDVTPFSVERQAGGTVILHSLEPRASAGSQIFPAEAAARDPGAGPGIRAVPNPYVARAEWDLSPNRTDPSGRKIVFAGLPANPTTVQIYTLAGDLVRALEHDGRTGEVDWDLLSRNGQPVVSGVYLYVVQAPGILERGKLVVVQ